MAKFVGAQQWYFYHSSLVTDYEALMTSYLNYKPLSNASHLIYSLLHNADCRMLTALRFIYIRKYNYYFKRFNVRESVYAK
jgi:hypothetical protein